MPAIEDVIQEGIGRIQAAYQGVGDEVEKLQKQLANRRKSLEKELAKRRKTLEKDARKRVDGLLKEIRNNEWVKRAEDLREDASKQIEEGLESVLGTLQIASRNEVRRIDRKISQLHRKLKELEKAA